MTDNQNLNDISPEPKLYEIGYLLSPLVPAESKADSVAKEISQVVAAHGGSIEAEISPNFIKLAYPVSKSLNHKKALYKDAYFGASRFMALPKSLAAIKADLDKSPVILRFLLTVAVPGSPFEVVQEEVVSTEAAVTTPVAVAAEAVEEAPVEAANPQVIDAEIDSLLTTGA